MKDRVMVDMSASILHHGHIRLLKKASDFGVVVVGLASDEDIFNAKGFVPRLSFEYRKEILESIKYVTEVVCAPWLVTDETLDQFRCRFLVHGDDNQNSVSEERLIIFKRTPHISSTQLRAT